MPMERAVPMMDLHMDSSDMYWQSGSACLILAISYTCFGVTTPATLWPASPPNPNLIRWRRALQDEFVNTVQLW